MTLRKWFICHPALFLSISIFLPFEVTSDTLPTCQPTDFHYEYTECDSDGGRWRVSVPKPNICIAGAPNPPVRGRNCSFMCRKGQYLNLTGEQQCADCPPGTYSLGNAAVFDYWDKIPDSFIVSVEQSESSPLWGQFANFNDFNCSQMTWKAHESYIYTYPGICTITLTYSSKLVSENGMLTFEYQYTDPDVLFMLTLQNEQCQSYDVGFRQWLDVSSEGEWNTLSIPLTSGTSIFRWVVFGSYEGGSLMKTKPVFIRKIEVTGVAFANECTLCRPGTRSVSGTTCVLCDADKFSSSGASSCRKCQSDEYSYPGSAVCSKRPQCTVYDYQQYQTPCDRNNQTNKVYQWNEPQVCSEHLPGAVVLPPATVPTDCPPCDTGMFPTDSGCEFCPEGTISNGRTGCAPCTVSTEPDYGIHFHRWTALPPNVSSSCFFVGSSTCSKAAGWLPRGTSVVTSYGPSDLDTFLVLSLNISGFRGEPTGSEGMPVVLGHISVEFEIGCKGKCELMFLMDTVSNTKTMSWSGNVERNTYTQDVVSNLSMTASWVFRTWSLDGGNGESINMAEWGAGNFARIYGIDVTNTINGGASVCLPCPVGHTENGCVPCPDGQYIDVNTTSCMDCPIGTVLSSSVSWGRQSCQACMEGLKAMGRRVCKSDCLFHDSNGRLYDFTLLDGAHFVRGGRLFTSSGTMYYHGFNLTLCNGRERALPTCVNNVTAVDLTTKYPSSVSGMICRSTMIPEVNSEKPLVSTQPLILATHLTKIVHNVSHNDLYLAGGFATEGSHLDIHFYYKSDSHTISCDGRTTVISMHCDSDELSSDAIQTPPKCSDGTCDGCTFHFLWKTRHACPRCRDDDYEVIRGECVDGEQLLHYYPPTSCITLDDDKLRPVKQQCRMVPFTVTVVLPVSLVVGLILILLLIFCWSRNKKLEYKYCKLVETSRCQDGGDLPGVESCGMGEDEEEECVTVSRGKSLVQRIRLKVRGASNKNDDDNPFTSVRMHEKLPLS